MGLSGMDHGLAMIAGAIVTAVYIKSAGISISRKPKMVEQGSLKHELRLITGDPGAESVIFVREIVEKELKKGRPVFYRY